MSPGRFLAGAYQPGDRRVDGLAQAGEADRKTLEDKAKTQNKVRGRRRR